MADAWYSALDVVLPGSILGANGAGAGEKEELQSVILGQCHTWKVGVKDFFLLSLPRNSPS